MELAKIVYILGLTNILGLFLVFFSCRCLLGAKLTGKLMKYQWYQKFYQKHCFFWWFFFISVILHVFFVTTVFGNPFSQNFTLNNNPAAVLEERASASGQITETGKFREIQVTGDEFSYDPPSINLTVGEKTRIIFKNKGKAPHDFVIENLGIKSKVIPGGESAVLEFTPSSSGVFAFFCSVGNHRFLGMEGKLTISK